MQGLQLLGPDSFLEDAVPIAALGLEDVSAAGLECKGSKGANTCNHAFYQCYLFDH